MTSEELCMALLRAESESAVESVLAEAEANNKLNVTWHPLDKRETNFNVVTNQAATGAKALTELCTNMVDAILLRRAYESGLDPTSREAPQSVTEAVRELVRLRGARSGILAEVDDANFLRDYAESNLVIAVTGSSSDTCFTFVDAGEGQLPDDFESTFFSLSSGRKSKIPFVQGKYNMGSAGVLSFCGRRWFKLVISRRFDGSGPWGWSLMRRRPGKGTPVAEFLRIDGRIPRFKQGQLHPLSLSDGQLDAKVARPFGTIVKLYSYVLGRPANFRTIREALNENLISTVLPFRLMDYRASVDRVRGGRRALGVDERTVNGMDYQLRALDQESDEDERAELAGEPMHVADIRDSELGTVRIQAVPLPPKLPGWLKSARNRMRVYHAVNGQVQYKRGRDYISGACRLPGLKDEAVILVDASELSESAHNDVWKGDRETIRQTEIGEHYEAKITDAIRNSNALKRLEERRRNEKTEQLAKQAQTDLFQSVISSDPHIAQLLPGGTVVKLPGMPTTSGRAPYDGRYHPTFVELVGKRLRKEGVDIEVGNRRRIRFETDARNDWLTRPDNRGRIGFLRQDGTDAGLGFSAELMDGSLAVAVETDSVEAAVGEIIETELHLADDGMHLPVKTVVVFRVVASRRKRRRGRDVPRRHRGDDGDEPGEGRDLPKNQWITKDGRMIGAEPTKPWSDFDDYADQDVGAVQDLGEGEKIYYINYDNAHFQYFLVRERTDVQKRVLTEQFRLSMLILMMGFEDAYSRLRNSGREVGWGEWDDEVRRLAARGAATVVMSIAKTLPTLVTADTVGDPDD